MSMFITISFIKRTFLNIIKNCLNEMIKMILVCHFLWRIEAQLAFFINL